MSLREARMSYPPAEASARGRAETEPGLAGDVAADQGGASGVEADDLAPARAVMDWMSAFDARLASRKPVPDPEGPSP